MSIFPALQYICTRDRMNWRCLFQIILASNDYAQNDLWLHVMYKRATFGCYRGHKPRNDGFVKPDVELDDAHALFRFFGILVK